MEKPKEVKVIGLEFIVSLFNQKYKDVSEKIGVSPKTMNDWVKGRSGIPLKHLKSLTEHFGIREELFSKVLTRAEKIELNIIYLESTDEEYEYEDRIEDDEGNEHWVTQTRYEHESIINLLGQELEIAEKIDYIEGVFNELINGIENLDMNNDMFEKRSFLNNIADFIEFMENSDSKKIRLMSNVLYFLTKFYGVEINEWEKEDGFVTSNINYDFYVKLAEAFSIFDFKKFGFHR